MSDAIEYLEKGNIYFFYRPRVEHDEAHSQSDVQRFYMVLKPENDKHFRLAIVGQKELPDPDPRDKQKYWGYIDMVREQPEPIRNELSEKVYNTRTKGERHLPPARPAGQGNYGIVRHGNHTHLLYKLHLPEKPGDVQKEFNIAEEAGYVITIKNPQYGSPEGAGLPVEEQVNFPQELLEKFRNRRFSEADPPEFLNHQKAEFILISGGGCRRGTGKRSRSRTRQYFNSRSLQRIENGRRAKACRTPIQRRVEIRKMKSRMHKGSVVTLFFPAKLFIL